MITKGMELKTEVATGNVPECSSRGISPERLGAIREEMLGVAHSAREASRETVADFASLLAELLEIAQCLDGLDGDQWSQEAEQLRNFCQDGVTVLFDLVEDSPEVGQKAERLELEARRRWGEYLGLLEHEAEVSAVAGAESWQGDPLPLCPARETAESEQEPDQLPPETSSAHVGLILTALDTPSESPLGSVKREELFGTAKRTQVRQPGTSDATSVGSPPPPGEIDVDDELRCAYLDDARRGLASMEESLLAFEAEPDSREALHQLCRELHTLKGASASVGLSELAKYLHEVEDYIQQHGINGTGRLDVEPLFRAIDAVRAQMTSLAGESSRSHPEADQATPGVAESAREFPASFQDESGSGTESVRVEASRLDRLMDLLAELVIIRNRRDRHTAQLKLLQSELVRCVARLRTLSDGCSVSGMTARTPEPRILQLEPSGVESLPVTASQHGILMTEIANDIAEFARSLRELYEPAAAENLAVTRLMGQFRHELMQLRRMPLAGLFRRLQRAARDAAREEGKQVRFEVRGEHSGLERSVQERLFEPLLHLVRNAVSHGVESESVRIAAGKPAVGSVTLEAIADPTLLVLEVRDDGRGLDYDKISRRGRELGMLPPGRPASRWQLEQLLFQPGFSTQTNVNAVSGRGVGMDVVASAVDRLHGQLEVESTPGQGTSMRLRIPLRSVIEHIMVFRVSGQLLALPMQAVQSSQSTGHGPGSGDTPVGRPLPSFELGHGSTAKPLAENPPLIRLRDMLSLDGQPAPQQEHLIMIDAGHGFPNSECRGSEASISGQAKFQSTHLGLVVDAVVGPEEVVVRSLPPQFGSQRLLAGVTLSGSGEIVLLLDSRELLEMGRQQLVEGHRERAGVGTPIDLPRVTTDVRALVIDDSLSARRSVGRILQRWGLEVTEAADGIEAINLLRSHTYSVVFTDLDMPRLGGLELVGEIKCGRRARSEKVVVISSSGNQEVQKQLLELGADGYLAKPASEASLGELLARLGLKPEFSPTKRERQ